MTDYQRMMAEALSPLTEKCATCGEPAGIGFNCRSKSGYTVPFHAARKKAVAHLTEDERIAAFGALRAEQSRRRAATVAYIERAKTDPEVQRQRAWWNDQFARIDAEAAASERDFRARCTDAPFRNSRTHADGCTCRSSGVVEYTPEFARVKRERERDEALRGTRRVTDLAQVRAMRGAR
jgi:hypothetical protein